MKFFFFLTILFLIYNKVKNDFATNEAVKKSIINSNYDPTLQPQDFIRIGLGFQFNHLIKVDQISKIITTSSILIATWMDQRLAWNSSQYPINSIALKANQIWLPDLYVINSADSNGFLPVTNSNLVNASSNGFVSIIYGLTNLNTRCSMSLYKFPYDSQTCSITIGSWSLSNHKISLDILPGYGSIFFENSLWKITKTSGSVQNSTRIHDTYPTSDAYFEATFVRKPMYYLINNVYPCLILNIITLFTFYFPFAQQAALTLTTFLSMAVISVRAAGDLPVISDYMPLISLYFFLSLLYTFLSFVWFSASNHFKTNDSSILIKFAKLITRFKKMKIFTSIHQVTARNENELLLSTLNNVAFTLMSALMFISYLTIFIMIAN